MAKKRRWWRSESGGKAGRDGEQRQRGRGRNGNGVGGDDDRIRPYIQLHIPILKTRYEFAKDAAEYSFYTKRYH